MSIRPVIETRRAEHDARVETVKTADGQTRYRVSVGPFADPAALANARRALRDVGIDTL